MTPKLSDLSRCLHGIAPTVIATCSKDGEPNVTYLSHTYFVDEGHVALSRQFFNKTSANIAENPYASLQFYDPLLFEAYEVDVRFHHAETSGPLFDTMALRIEAIASHTGMSGVFKLIAADVYEVLSIRKVEGFAGANPSDPRPLPQEAPSSPPKARSELRALQVVSSRLSRAPDLEQLFAELFAALRDELGFEHGMILLPDESGAKLFTVASSGYGESGVGAEVELGEGFLGAVAQQRKILRLSAVDQDLRYGRAIRREVRTTSGESALEPEIPLAGLPEAQSHLGIPLLVQDRLVGVLAFESKNPMQFDDWHEAFLDVVANQVAVAIERMVAREDESEPSRQLPASRPAPVKRARVFKFYRGDDAVFVDGQYLIRNVPGRILWRLLRSHVDERRAEFTNRELRLDPFLELPAIKDNLESRLILLRKRLEQKCPDLRIPSCGRGHFRLEADCAFELVEIDGA